MKEQINTSKENKSLTPSREQVSSESQASSSFDDNRPAQLVQRKLRDGMAASPPPPETAQLRHAMQNSGQSTPSFIQRKSNRTGLPNQLKSGIENLSGFAMDDVKVHYNSSKPAQLQAHAYAQGSDIHLGAGQEKHLPHEAWHVVQQKQGRVKPTRQLKSKVNINDDTGLEKEADVMGAKAMQGGSGAVHQLREAGAMGHVAQLQKKSKGAKVGLEIETTLPVRKHTEETYLLNSMNDYQQCFGRGTTNTETEADARPKKSKKDLQTILKNSLDLKPKEVIYEGKGWRAEADHAGKIEELHKKGILFTKACVEIVTEPIADVDRAGEIMKDIHKWIAETLKVADETGAAHYKHKKSDTYTETYVIEMPADAKALLMDKNGGGVLGNFQINLGAFLEEVPEIYQDNVKDVLMPGFRNPQERLVKHLASDHIWDQVWGACKPLLASELIIPDDEPYLRSIMFQYMYEFGSYAMRDRGMMDTLKNSYMILRKTSVAQQVALSTMPSKANWESKKLSSAFSGICKTVFDQDAFVKENLLKKDVAGQFPAVFPNMSGHRSAVPHVKIQEVNDKDDLDVGDGRYAGVFELRGMQGKLRPQQDWLGIWLHYLDAENNANPYKQSKTIGTYKPKKINTRQAARVGNLDGFFKNLLLPKVGAGKTVPAVNPPVANVPAANVPAANVPVANQPVANVPAANVPVANVPAANVPVANVPAANVPVANVPAANVPVANVPAANVPVANVPAANVPVANVPVANVPVANVPVANPPYLRGRPGNAVNQGANPFRHFLMTEMTKASDEARE